MKTRKRKRIALLVDGESEFSLAHLYPALVAATGNAFIKPALIGVNGMSRPERIAAEVVSRISIIQSRYGRLDKAVILLDREKNTACPGVLRSAIEAAVASRLDAVVGTEVSVVVKNSTFENWLIADTQAIQRLSGRFQLSRRQLRSIAPDRADSIADAEALLSSAAKRPGYNKTRDATEIMKESDPLRIAANSRSFRRLLRCLEHPQYGRQSRLP